MIIGQWRYPAMANARLIVLTRSGLLDLRHWKVAAFGMGKANEAVGCVGLFRLTSLQL